MKLSHGFARLWPSRGVAALFVVGAALLARAIQHHQLATIYVLGLGIEAIITVGVGIVLVHEHLTFTHACGIILIAAGVAAVRFG